jgi:RimJ/RimL family protein N-acetyltransferase
MDAKASVRNIRSSTPAELEKLCREVELVPTVNLRGVTLEVNGEAVLIVGYDGWTDGSCVMHQWAKHPKYFGRDILREAFRYAFGVAGLQTVIGTVRSDNPKALEVDRKIGFLTAAVVPNAYGPGVDLHLLHLPRHLCKWYKP